MLAFLTSFVFLCCVWFVSLKLLSSSCTQAERCREGELVPTLALGPSSLKVLRYGDSAKMYRDAVLAHVVFIVKRCELEWTSLVWSWRLLAGHTCSLVTEISDFFFQSPYSFCLCECQFRNGQRSIHLSRNQNEAVGVSLRTHTPFPHPSEVSLSTVGRTGCLELKF